MGTVSSMAAPYMVNARVDVSSRARGLKFGSESLPAYTYNCDVTSHVFSYLVMGKYVFERPFDGDDQKNAILAPLIDCHDQIRTIHSIFFSQ